MLREGSCHVVLITTLPHLEPTAVVEAYDGRATIEAAFCQDKQGIVDSRKGAIVGVRGKAMPSETMSRLYRRHATHRSGGKGQALLACRACKDSVTLTALEIQGQATDDLRGIPRPPSGEGENSCCRRRHHQYTSAR